MVSALASPYQPSQKGKTEIARFAALASASLAKDKRVNIRISSRDLDDIQAKAAEEAIPYQTLMSSVLHKYVTGRLVEPSPSLTRRSSGTRQNAANETTKYLAKKIQPSNTLFIEHFPIMASGHFAVRRLEKIYCAVPVKLAYRQL